MTPTDSAGCHAAWYRENLSHCTEAMLHYEWAWLNAHIEALARCDSERAQQLLEASRLCCNLLREEFDARSLDPREPRGSVIASEEAWEITSLQVKKEWGIV